MRINEALKSGEISLDFLKNTLGILVKEDGDYIVLNYTMHLSPKTNPFVTQCRGIILNKHNYDVVCLPFDRFFNYGENNAGVNLDWNSNDIKVMEKVDGSLIKIWYDKGKWNISTRGTVYCDSSNVCLSGLTYEKLVLNSFGVLSIEDFQEKFKDANKELTHLFELTSPQNRVVTDYGDSPVMHYLASRNKQTGSYSKEGFLGVKYRNSKMFSLNSVNDCILASKELDNLQEGYVVYVNGVPSFKIKSPQYVVVHHIRGEGLTAKRICELVLIEEHDEYLNYFPEDRKYFTPYLNKYEEILSEIEFNYSLFKNIENQKQFAIAVKDFEFKCVLFSMRNYNKTAKEGFNNILLNQRVEKLIKHVGDIGDLVV